MKRLHCRYVDIDACSPSLEEQLPQQAGACFPTPTWATNSYDGAVTPPWEGGGRGGAEGGSGYLQRARGSSDQSVLTFGSIPPLLSSLPPALCVPGRYLAQCIRLVGWMGYACIRLGTERWLLGDRGQD